MGAFFLWRSDMRRSFWLLTLVLLAGCGREGIDAADRAATAAWGELWDRAGERITLMRELTRDLCPTAPKEATSLCGAVERSIREEDAEGKGERPAENDRDAVGRAGKRYREWGYHAESLRSLRKGPVGEDPVVAALIDRVLAGNERALAARDRYNDAVLAYNRALATFPESVTNNLLLHLEPRASFAESRQFRRDLPARR